jgi:hypothetical protein
MSSHPQVTFAAGSLYSTGTAIPRTWQRGGKMTFTQSKQKESGGASRRRRGRKPKSLRYIPSPIPASV